MEFKKRIIFNDPNSEPPKNWIWQKNKKLLEFDYNTKQWVLSKLTINPIDELKKIIVYSDKAPAKNQLWGKEDKIYRYNQSSNSWIENINNQKIDYSKIPFTIEAYGDGVISWNIENRTVLCSKNKSKWQSMTGNLQISVTNGDTLEFLGDNEAYNGCTITSTAEFTVFGNINSLISSENFENIEALTFENTFRELFKNSSLINAERLILAATTLSSHCYQSMFNGCTGLTSAPELPATTLADSCYYYMFKDCTNLTIAPELHATTLAERCYQGIFQDCTSIAAAPVLPATTLAASCYQYMFKDCTGLTSAPELLPATTLASYCYSYMFSDCTSLTVAPKLPATTLATSCYQYMFQNCTSLTVAPELPATTLTTSCYKSMFAGCASLEYIKAMFTTTPGFSYTSGWVKSVKATGTFVKNSVAIWNVTGNAGVPTGWTVETADA